MTVQRFIKYHNFDTDLFRSGARLWGLVTPFYIDKPCHIQVSGFVNVRHKGNPNVIVGISSRIGIRTAVSLSDFDNTTLYPVGTQPGSWNAQDFMWIDGAKDGKNLLDVSQHYETLNLSASMFLSIAGAYRIEPYLFEMSSLAPYSDGLTCVNIDINQATDDTFGFLSTIITPI